MPMNLEGPILYYRTDHLQKMRPSSRRPPLPMSRRAAKKLKACDSGVTPFVFARPEAGASLYVQQHAAQYRRQLYRERQIQSLLAAGQGKRSRPIAGCCATTARPGVVNYSFYQISALYRSGRAAMAFESSNELRTVMEGGRNG